MLSLWQERPDLPPIELCRCGGRAVVYPVHVGLFRTQWAVVCTVCYRYDLGPVRWTEGGAIDAWNAQQRAAQNDALRATISAQAVRIQALEDDLETAQATHKEPSDGD